MPVGLIDASAAKRVRSSAWKPSADDVTAAKELLTEAKTNGKLIGLTDVEPFDVETKTVKKDGKNVKVETDKARNRVIAKLNVWLEILTPEIEGGYLKTHVVRTDDGYVGAVRFKEGAKPVRKPRAKQD